MTADLEFQLTDLFHRKKFVYNEIMGHLKSSARSPTGGFRSPLVCWNDGTGQTCSITRFRHENLLYTKSVQRPKVLLS